MQLLPEGRLRVHPEIVDKFNELVRYYFNAVRKGKEAADIRETMRAQDAKEQAAMLTGKCEIETKTTHARNCYSNMGSLLYNLPCDCTPTQEIIFKAKEEKENSFLSFRYYGGNF
jgi:hypothetical protein